MKTIVITGATSGIGLACVKKFIKDDCLIVGTGRSIMRLNYINKIVYVIFYYYLINHLEYFQLDYHYFLYIALLNLL